LLLLRTVVIVGEILGSEGAIATIDNGMNAKTVSEYLPKNSAVFGQKAA
jgi:hypothetical protein